MVGSGSRRIRRAALSPATLRKRLDLLADGGADARHAEVAPRAELRGVEARGVQQEADRGARRSEPVAHGFRHRQHRFLAGERLADDAGEEARRRLVRLARAHADRRQADADAVEEAAPAVVGEQQLADRLLRAVARERRVQELVADRLGKRRAEHRDRGGEHDARLVVLVVLSDRFEKAPRAVEVDPVALLEVRLGFARDDGGEMEDEIGARGDELLGFARRRQVRDRRAAVEGHHVVQDELARAVLAQARVSLRPIMPAAPMTRIVSSPLTSRDPTAATRERPCARRRP